MTTRPPPRPAVFRWTHRPAAAGVGAAAGLLWLRCLYLVFVSRFASDPLFDPSGYALIGGTILSVPAALITAVAVPFAFPAHHRARVVQVMTPVLLLITASAWIAFVTA
ncbi:MULTISPECIES: hypothetical protein [Nocardia]|uniref:hypothetical protein n=1 Tax=Nocardia TaxID=1817 RepID=UPI001893A791|nr:MULTISPECIES: hypothetical protein [Nocardia]MBF6352060.1 hypothetical protein [Nocardia flavorosea]